MSVLVRARPTSLDGFLGGMGPPTSVLSDLVSRLRLEAGGFTYRPPYAVSPGRPSPGMAFLPRRAIGDSGGYVVPEYQPVIHRLRLAASA